jgi:hypothetical protein
MCLHMHTYILYKQESGDNLHEQENIRISDFLWTAWPSNDKTTQACWCFSITYNLFLYTHTHIYDINLYTHKNLYSTKCHVTMSSIKQTKFWSLQVPSQKKLVFKCCYIEVQLCVCECAHMWGGLHVHVHKFILMFITPTYLWQHVFTVLCTLSPSRGSFVLRMYGSAVWQMLPWRILSIFTTIKTSGCGLLTLNTAWKVIAF